MRRDNRGLPLWAGRTLALICIVLAAANLRTAIAALSPIFAEISVDVPLGSLRIGLLGTLPPLCFAVFGLLAPVLWRRMALESLLMVSLIASTAGHAIRALSDSYLVLASASTLTFAGMGVANVVLPPIIKKYFPDRVGLMTSLYVTAMTLFNMVPALAAVPAADAFGWRVSVGMWAVLGVLAVGPWLALWLRERRGDGETLDVVLDEVAPSVIGRVWHSGLAWALTVLFGMTAFNVFAVYAWLPEILTDIAGVPPAEAGSLLALYASVSVPLSIFVPMLAMRLRTPRPLLAAGTCCYIAAYLGILLAPAAATWLWVILGALGTLMFPLILVLINQRTRTVEGAIALSGFTQGVGYLIGSAGPLVVGILDQLTGAWTGALMLLIATACLGGVTAVIVARPRMLEDDWYRAGGR